MKTILNKKNVDTTKQPLFLGEDLALQRYEKPKYESFLQLFRKQISLFWTPEEVNLTLVSSEFKTLSDHEKHIFTKNLQFQTLMDSVIARGVPILTEHVSNPELEVCMSAWQFFENIHSYAYTYLIKNVYSDPTAIMNGVLEDQEILARCDSVSREYDRLRECSEGDLKKQIYLTLISINILEAIRFYVSFVMGFAFANNKKMIGNADILRLIKRDEACMTGDTEILTINGWVAFDDLEDGIEVAQYNADGTIKFVVPNKVIRKEYTGDMINIVDTLSQLNMMVTPDHRIIYKSKDHPLLECEAKDFQILDGVEILTINQRKQELIKQTISNFYGFVYCVSVPSGMFLARSNNSVFVSGNCHLQITQEIIKILRENPEEGFQEIVEANKDEAINMFKFAVEEEKAWAQYLFKDGGLLGLNYEIVSKYIEWLADTRLEQLHLPRQYGIKKSPIGGWITPWMDSESVQVAPQESEITSYKVFSSKSDLSNSDFSDLEL